MYIGNHIEVWSYLPVWNQPSKWEFSTCRCPTGCLIITIGWFGLTFLKGDCIRNNNPIISLEEEDLP